jgi:hypothetical protein
MNIGPGVDDVDDEEDDDVAGPAGHGVGRRGEVGILVEDPLGEAAQLRHRLHAELVGQDAANPLEGAQGVCLATEPVERKHQLRPRSLPQGVREEVRLQPVQCVLRSSAAEQGVAEVLDRS